MPQEVRLLRQCSDQFRVAVAEAVNCYSHPKIEISVATFGKQIGTLATLKRQFP
jgi:hypothetical protein